mmetsp:Transcript_6929/g.9837  ORF Transcript_6929/g.9837 Transcript_6929/m.9837 type:complete len:92 (-) Transcript_6929:815-1090(-)
MLVNDDPAGPRVSLLDSVWIDVAHRVGAATTRTDRRHPHHVTMYVPRIDPALACSPLTHDLFNSVFDGWMSKHGRRASLAPAPAMVGQSDT